jgi:acetyl esterase/lipase
MASLDRNAQRFLELLEVARTSHALERSCQAYRNRQAQLSAFAAPPAACRVADARLETGSGGSLSIRIYGPDARDREKTAALLWFHGGGWIAGGLSSSDALCRSLCQSSGCTVIAVDYRLAPEHPFPAGLRDCCDAIAALSAQAADFGIDADRIAIGGDSAGAHLAVVASRMACDRGLSLACQLLLCPVIDPFGDWPSRRSFARGYLLEETAIADYLRFYGHSLDPSDIRLSPLRAQNFAGLPPTDVHTAEFDPVRDEGCAYAAALADAGVPIRYNVHAGMIHNFYSLGGVIPRAREIVAAIGEALGRALNAGSHQRNAPASIRAQA